MADAPVLLIFAHPYPDRSIANRKLLEAVDGLRGVAVRSLYDLYPTFDVDVASEQAALRAAQVLVLQHPMYWYSVPSLLEHWFDKVLARGFAYGQGGKALWGKRCLWVVTTGGDERAFSTLGMHGRPFREFMPVVEQTALFCGMSWEEPLVVYGAHRLPPHELELAARDYRDRLASLVARAERGEAPARPRPRPRRSTPNLPRSLLAHRPPCGRAPPCPSRSQRANRDERALDADERHHLPRRRRRVRARRQGVAAGLGARLPRGGLQHRAVRAGADRRSGGHAAFRGDRRGADAVRDRARARPVPPLAAAPRGVRRRHAAARGGGIAARPGRARARAALAGGAGGGARARPVVDGGEHAGDGRKEPAAHAGRAQRLRALGIKVVERETFESAIVVGRRALEVLGVRPYEARERADLFRAHNVQTLETILPRWEDERERTNLARSAREQLEQQMREDRAEVERHAAGGWHSEEA